MKHALMPTKHGTNARATPLSRMTSNATECPSTITSRLLRINTLTDGYPTMKTPAANSTNTAPSPSAHGK